MELGSLLIIIVLNYYIFYLVPLLFNKDKRKNINEANNKLETIRNVSVKSLDQQKEFLDLRYPKHTKIKWSLMLVLKILVKILLFIIMSKIFGYVLSYFNIEFKLWQGILFMFVFPIIMNIILRQFNLQKNDMLVYLK